MPENFYNIISFVRSLYGRPEGTIPLHAPVFNGNEREYVLDAIDSTFVSSVGEYVDRFEGMMRDITGAKYAVATVNGTAALQVALKLAGVSSGDEVITQPLTFVATCNAITHAGGSPVFVDVDRNTLGLSSDALRAFLEQTCESRNGSAYNKVTGNRLSACVPMHTFGHPCRIEEICEVCNAYNIPVVEDAAEAIGSTRNGTHAGTFGLMGIYSFNGNKTVTCGGGGAIVTDDEDLAKRAKHITTTAKAPHPYEYVHDEIAFNYRMTNLNAALACAQLEQLGKYIADKRATAQAYTEFFDYIDDVALIHEPKNCRSNYWLNTILLPDKADRNSFLEETNSNGIMTRPVWTLMNELDMFRDCQCGPLKIAEELQYRVVNLPSSVRFEQKGTKKTKPSTAGLPEKSQK